MKVIRGVLIELWDHSGGCVCSVAELYTDRRFCYFVHSVYMNGGRIIDNRWRKTPTHVHFIVLMKERLSAVFSDGSVDQLLTDAVLALQQLSVCLHSCLNTEWIQSLRPPTICQHCADAPCCRLHAHWNPSAWSNWRAAESLSTHSSQKHIYSVLKYKHQVLYGSLFFSCYFLLLLTHEEFVK